MLTEITVTLKADERRYKEKFLCYEPISLNMEDATLADCVATARAGFKGEPEEIVIKATMVYE